MSEKQRGEAALDTFFDAIIEDTMDGRILKLISKDVAPERILEQLLHD